MTSRATQRILSLLEEGKELDSNMAAEQCFTCRRHAAEIFRALKAEGKIYRCGWNQYYATFAPVYKLGVGEDVPRPGASESFKLSPALVRMKRALQTAPGTKYELAEKVHCHHRTANRLALSLLAAGEIHIHKWVKEYNANIPVYRWGKGKNAPKPAALTKQELWQKKKNDVDVAERKSAWKRNKRALDRAAKNGLGLVALLGTK